MPSGTVSRHEKLRDSFGRDVERLVGRRVAQRGVDRLAGAGVGQRQPHRARLRAWPTGCVTLTVNSSTSPSRRNRGGLGWTIRSLAVTTLSCRKPLRSSASWAKPRNFHCGQRLGHGELQLHRALGVGDQVREEEGRLVQVLAGRDLAQVGAAGGGPAPAPAFAAGCFACAACVAAGLGVAPSSRSAVGVRGRHRPAVPAVHRHRAPRLPPSACAAAIGSTARPNAASAAVAAEVPVAPEVRDDVRRERAVRHRRVLAGPCGQLPLQVLQLLQHVLELRVAGSSGPAGRRRMPAASRAAGRRPATASYSAATISATAFLASGPVIDGRPRFLLRRLELRDEMLPLHASASCWSTARRPCAAVR